MLLLPGHLNVATHQVFRCNFVNAGLASFEAVPLILLSIVKSTSSEIITALNVAFGRSYAGHDGMFYDRSFMRIALTERGYWYVE